MDGEHMTFVNVRVLDEECGCGGDAFTNKAPKLKKNCFTIKTSTY